MSDMAIDAKKIMDKATKGSRKNYTISLDESLMETFKEFCEAKNAKYSSVIEELIKEFLESSKKRK